MDPIKRGRKTVKVLRASNIAEQGRLYLGSDYSLTIPPSTTTTPTGHLVLFRLVPRIPGLPTFTGRWDDTQNAIDVDMDGLGFDKRAFNAGRKGFKGHRTTLVSESPRVFKVGIHIPNRAIFESNITLNKHIGVSIFASMSFSDSAEIASSPSRTTDRK
jgi:hypothetical protein